MTEVEPRAAKKLVEAPNVRPAGLECLGKTKSC